MSPFADIRSLSERLYQASSHFIRSRHSPALHRASAFCVYARQYPSSKVDTPLAVQIAKSADTGHPRTRCSRSRPWKKKEECHLAEWSTEPKSQLSLPAARQPETTRCSSTASRSSTRKTRRSARPVRSVFGPKSIVTSLTALGALGVDASLEEAARVVARPARVVLHILLPAARPAIAFALIVVFALSLSELGVPMFLRVEVFPAAVFARLGGHGVWPADL